MDRGDRLRLVDPSIDTSSRTDKLVMGILALIAEFENDIRRERQMDGIAKARERGVRFGRKSLLQPDAVKDIRTLREAGATVPEIIRRTGLSKASVYRALFAMLSKAGMALGSTRLVTGTFLSLAQERSAQAVMSLPEGLFLSVSSSSMR